MEPWQHYLIVLPQDLLALNAYTFNFDVKKSRSPLSVERAGLFSFPELNR
jgi:hypothetical protein